ncbi:MAG TPA: Gfo/Idh/MocA family oxidoreductase [Luteolibacter sp.]|nr:Gfo/Idh/MocA family oxidoreductase [Luteolibacter sp.]
MQRRNFLATSSLVTAGLTLLPSGSLRAGQSANNKLNIALIGAWGRANAHYGWLKGENVVAVCDVNEAHFKHALGAFPGAKPYTDWRLCLDHAGLDAVVICTADHHHAFISNEALRRNLHVYCEKPLAISVEEARVLRAQWLTKKGKLATQVGTQMHAQENYARVKELILDGAIGELQSAIAWGNRQLRRSGYEKAGATPPPDLHWDLWLGPSPDHPYSPNYFSGGPGANCLQWNMYTDWGSGQIGDMGSHFMDLLYSVTDATLPTKISAKGEAPNPEVQPVDLETHFDHPANDWRGPIRISWYQGALKPRLPLDFIDLEKFGHGALFKGTKGFIIADYSKRILIPMGKDADMSSYKARTKERQLPAIGAFHDNWLTACKDPSKSTCCDFEYHANLCEQQQLGLVAYRTGKELEYDGKAGTVTNAAEANELLKRKYRAGWEMKI